jgi:Lon protease-like protein
MTRHIDITEPMDVEINGTDYTLHIRIEGRLRSQTRHEPAETPDITCIRAEWWDDEAEEDRETQDASVCASLLRSVESKVQEWANDTAREEIEWLDHEDYVARGEHA